MPRQPRKLRVIEDAFGLKFNSKNKKKTLADDHVFHDGTRKFTMEPDAEENAN